MNETIAKEQQNNFATQTLVKGEVLEYVPQVKRLFQEEISDDKLLPNTYIIHWGLLDLIPPIQKEYRINDKKTLEQGIDKKRQEKIDTIRQAKQWHELHKEEIIEKYKGRHIAIILNPAKGLRTPFKEAIVGAAKDFHSLAERIYKRYGYKTIYMPFITSVSTPKRIQVPTPLWIKRK